MSRRASLFLLPLIYLGFVSLGLPDGSIGVAWPLLHRDLGLPVGVAGTLLLVAALMSAAAGFSSGAVVRLVRTGPVITLSCALTGTGLLLIAHAPGLLWLWCAAVPLGLGAGAIDAALNGYVARHYSGRHMNWLHASWGLGATAGPLLMTRALATAGGWRAGFTWLAGLQLGLAALLLLTLRWWDRAPAGPAAVTVPIPPDPAGRPPAAGANSAAGWLSVGIFALYVAVEYTAALWAATILVEARRVPPGFAGLCTTAFFAAITSGRVAVGTVVDRWGNRRLIAAGLGLALLGALVFVLAPGGWPALGAMVLLGLGFAPTYPCLMHEVPRRFAPAAVQTVIGRQSASACLGMAFAPAAAGWVAGRTSLEVIPPTVVAGILLLALAIRRLDRMT